MFASPAAAILSLADRFAAARGLSLATVSLYCAGQGLFLARLQRGAGVTPRRANRVVAWFDSHWPAATEWPSDVPRPKEARPTPQALREERP